MLLLNSPTSDVICFIEKLTPLQGYHLILVDWCMGCGGRFFMYSSKRPHVISAFCPHCAIAMRIFLSPQHYNSINY